MEVTLTPELERFVADEIADGAFQTPEELVRALLALYRQKKQAVLRREIQIGLDDVERNGTVPLTDEFIAELKAEIERELEEEGASTNDRAAGEPASTGRLEGRSQGTLPPEQISCQPSNR